MLVCIFQVIVITVFTVAVSLTCRRAYNHKISAKKAKKYLTVCILLSCILFAFPIAYASFTSPKPEDTEKKNLPDPDLFIAPFGEPFLSITSTPFVFRLSEVQDSDAVDFGSEYFNERDTTFQDLLDAEQDALCYLELKRNIGDCVPLHSAVKLVSVDADKVSFQDKAKTLEECDERASVAYKNANKADQSRKRYWYKFMAQAGLDGLYLSRNEADMERRWQYAEIAFCGLLNMYIFQEYNSPVNSDLFYNFGQLFDHLGLIARQEKDTLLEYRMYFTATQFYGQAYNQLKQYSFAEEGVVYTDAVCDAYGKLLYRLGLYVTEKTKFYEAAKECGDEAINRNLCCERDLNNWLQPVKDKLDKIHPLMEG